MGDTEFELAICYNQASLLEVGLGYQASHKTFCLQSVPQARLTGVVMAQNSSEWPTNDRSNLGPMPVERTHAQHCLDGQETQVGWPGDPG